MVAASTAAKVAVEAAKPVWHGLFSDLAVVRTQMRPKGKKKPPVDLEFHLNPAALGIAAVGAGLTIWLLQMKLKPTKVRRIERRYIDVHYKEGTKEPDDFLPRGFEWTQPWVDTSDIVQFVDASVGGIAPGVSWVASMLMGYVTYTGFKYPPEMTMMYTTLTYPKTISEGYWMVVKGVNVWVDPVIETWVHLWGDCYKATENGTVILQERDGFKVGALP